MTEQEQRIAIAEYCKWPLVDDEGIAEVTFELYGGPGETGGMLLSAECDVLADLNAMHEAEKTVPDRQWSDALMRVIQDQENCGAVEARYKTAKATAAQRAEAFLRTIGKWKD